MPALFAYLITVGLLLGGGYGALTWLAAPEPVKIVAKAKPKLVPHYEANPEASSSAAGSGTAGASAPSSSARVDSDRATSVSAASDSNEYPPSPQPEVNVAAGEQGAKTEVSVPKAEVSVPAQDEQNRSANAEASAAEPKQNAEAAPAEDATQEAKLRAQAVPLVSPNRQPTTASTAAASVARPIKRLHLRQAHSEKPALALMTLRTIEFPDGRRVTQLIPYRNGERALEFQPDR